MKRTTIISMLAAVAATLLFTACERRPLEDDFGVTALIPVKIDWSRSNIPVTEARGNGQVHRVCASSPRTVPRLSTATSN